MEKIKFTWEVKSILVEDWVTYILEAQTDPLVSMSLLVDRGNFKIETKGKGKVHDWRLKAVISEGYPNTFGKRFRLYLKLIRIFVWQKLTKLVTPNG